MADFTYRANLSAPNIPVDPLTQGQTVIIKGYDNNYAPNLASSEDADKDIGIPQILYAKNVLPTEFGFRSMQYSGSKAVCDGTPYIAFPVRSSTDSALLVHTTEGYVFRLRKATESLALPVFIPVATIAGTVTSATVSGETYIFFRGTGCYRYDFPTKALVAVTLTGLTVADIIGITGTGGYLLAWSADAIAWSSLVDPTDFVPSVDTGAGGGSVEGARGAITVCVSNPYGIYVFTENNCVSAQLSNNARFPFNFKEIVGSSGVTDQQQVTFEGNQNTAYAYTPNGFQQITHSSAKTVWSDLFDSGNATPDWDETTIISSAVTQGASRKITGSKVTVVNSRYVCISIASGDSYSSAWVYDLTLKRWGRLVKAHLEIFEDEDHNFAMITADGRYVICDTAFTTSTFEPDTDSVPILILGKYQYSRQRLTTFQELNIENLYPRDMKDPVTGLVTQEDKYPQIYLLTTLDGKSGEFVEMYRDTSVSTAFARYLKRLTGLNHTLLVKGDFILNSVVLKLTNHGGR